MELDRQDRSQDEHPEVTPVVSRVGDSDRPSRRHWIWAIAGSFLALLVLLTATGRIEALARSILRGFGAGAPVLIDRVTPEPEERPSDGLFRLRDLDFHPDLLYQPYTSGAILGDSTSATARIIQEFRELLYLYEQRQGIDDNFTMRVVDNRTGSLLELYTLEEERAKYEETHHADWDQIDRLRREHTRRLVDKHAARGIPRTAVTVKWGRANQVLEARDRDLPFIEYEIKLARYLGLSLLATEIGTVETFNQDWLVSAVGARSRYQMMPALLRREGIRHYSLRSAGGSTVNVFEEWHPLLTMEPALVFLRGYVNAVGHEIPGISAYHAGPANIFGIYRKYLTEARDLIAPGASVLDAYAWGVTRGFDSVSKGSSFGQHSRGYVASNYGSLRATDSLVIDTTHTMLAEQVQLRSGKQAYLSQLLRTLAKHEGELLWPRQVEDRSLYQRFRFMNPHISVPDAPDSVGVPVNGDVRFVSEVDGADVRFFLPLGASRILAAAGVDVLDSEKMRRFDHDTYADPNRGEKTMYDRMYEDLVADISKFGFNRANRAQLFELANRFSELAQTSPSHYRHVQNDIIQTHKGVWQWSQWETLAHTVAAVEGELRAAARPVAPLGVALPDEVRTSNRP